MFKAILNHKKDDKQHTELTEGNESALPKGDVTVRVAYSTLNYKDALAITGKSPVVRSFPMVPGIDFAGTVTERSEEHTSELQSLMRISYAVFCLKKKKTNINGNTTDVLTTDDKNDIIAKEGNNEEIQDMKEAT